MAVLVAKIHKNTEIRLKTWPLASRISTSLKVRHIWISISVLHSNHPPPCILRSRRNGSLGIEYRCSGSKKKTELWGYRAGREVWPCL